MNRIIEIKTVRSRLSLPDDEGVNDAIDSAIDAALIGVSSILGTSFGLAEKEDVFFIDPSVETSVSGLYLLRLSMGFVKTTPTLKVCVGSSLEEVLSADPTPIPTLLNPEKGFLKVPDTLTDHKYVRVTYTAGFTEDEEAPDWLMEAMLGYTIKAMSSQQVSDGKPELSGTFKFLDGHSSAILDRHLRTSSSSIFPLV